MEASNGNSTATEYVVLAQRIHGEEPVTEWRVVDKVPASGGEQAIKGLELPDGVYVAVPARSWRPMNLAVETTRKETLTPA